MSVGSTLQPTPSHLIRSVTPLPGWRPSHNPPSRRGSQLAGAVVPTLSSSPAAASVPQEAMAAPAPAKASKAERLSAQWQSFRLNGGLAYDVLLWRNLKWPALAMAWLPASTWQQPPGVAAAQRAADDRRQDAHTTAVAAGADGSQPHLAAMPVEHHHLLLGEQTSGAAGAHLVLYRAEVAGQEWEQQQQQQQQQQAVVMQEGELLQVMRISHGACDVNRLAVMPSDPNWVATCCDEPEVYLFDLRQHDVRQELTEAQLVAAGLEQLAATPGDAPAAGGGALQSSSGSGGGEDGDGASSTSDGDDGSDSGGSSPSTSAPPRPQAVLVGRPCGGFGLEFNPVKPWLLLAGDLSGGVVLWDAQAASRSSGGGSGSSASRIQPMQAVPALVPCGINDVSWHRSGTAYALATESGQVWVQDMRAPGSPSSSPSRSPSRHGLSGFQGRGVAPPRTSQLHVHRAMKSPRAQQQQREQQDASQLGAQTDTDCLCVAFDPCHEHRLASGGADGYVYVLDSRRLGEPLQQLRLHAGSVTSVAWSPTRPGLLATAGEDGVVLLWDADKMQQPGAAAAPAQQQRPRDEHARLDVGGQVAALGQRGLLWAHGGHLSPVSAVALNADRPWLVASASEREVAAPGGTGESVVVQRRHVMVWEVNRAGAAFR